MTVRTPILDDRTFGQLRDELIARIPVFAPEWTDHHPSDPGITILELFAFLGENLLWRFNQIPDATKLAFLDLLQVPMRPAAPASAMVALSAPDPTGPVVPMRTRALAGDVAFETLDEVQVWPLTARAAIRMTPDGPVDEESAEYLARTREALGIGNDDGVPYVTHLAAGDPTVPGGDVVDPRRSVDGMLWVAVVGSDALELDDLAEGLLTVGFVPSEDVPTMDDAGACPGTGGSPVGAQVTWEMSTKLPAPRSAGEGPAVDPVWWTVSVEADTTAGLTEPGVVRLRLPADLTDAGVFEPDDVDLLGAGDQPPLVEDEDLDEAIVFWLRAFRSDDGELGGVEWLGANAARVEQASSAAAEHLGTGTGEPDQQYALVHPGVLGDPEIEVEEHGAQAVWRRYLVRDDLRGSGPEERVVLVDRAAGTVRFGDGARGRVPQIGERIRARSYRYGGGDRGNVAAEAIGEIRLTESIAGLTIANPLPAAGGREAETLEEAVSRIPDELRRRDRCVTESDFAELARIAGVARAECLPRFHPTTPQVDPAAGVVTVVVWPDADPVHPTAPRPTRSLLRRVCTELDRRRLITTELHVIPPTYRTVAVSVGLRVKDGHGIEAVRRWVELVLRQYLGPIPPNGPEGAGWPLGRRVHGPELEAAALQVEGVEYLEGLRLAELVDGEWVERAAPPTVELEKWEVPEVGAVTVVSGRPLDPATSPLPPQPGDGDAGSRHALPVRAPREVCS